MTSLPRFEMSGPSASDTQVCVEPSLEAASWSGDPPLSNDDLIGQTLSGTYVVEGVIGEGGMGRVYRASHTRIKSKRFAIKVLRQEFSLNQEVVARFRREAEAAACISHPNVVEVYDVDTTSDGCSYLVCEYLAGLDLSDYLLSAGPLEPLRAVNLALQVAHALSAAHDSGVIHRDVKPHNIFLIADERGRIPDYPAAKVLDFGLSRFMDSTGTQLTRAGVVMGTPAYMSPEQANGQPVDARTDVYGLGAVLFAALAGRAPYEGENLQAVVMAVIGSPPERLRRVRPEVPERLELIVDRAMARDAAERYQSMEEFRSALEDYFARATAHTLAPSPMIRLSASAIVAEPDDDELASARPRLVAYGVGLTLLAGLAAATSVSGLEGASGPLKLSRLEVLLLLCGLTGTLVTPALLLFAKVRKTVWSSHTKVLALLARLRGALLSAVLAYGAVTLGLLVVDDVLGRVMTLPLSGQGLGTGFRGFNPVYFGVSAVWVGVSLHLSAMFPRSRGRSATIGTMAVGVVCSLLLVGAGLAFRGQRAVAAVAVRPAASAAAQTLLPAASSSAVAVVAPNPTIKIPSPSAPDEELARATTQGTEGLLALSERYPEDPNVLRSLFLSFASRATGLADAMAVARRLLTVSPKDALDSDLRYLVRRAAISPGQASPSAFDIMTDQMGGAGADLLYDLMVSEPRVSKTAEARLMSDKVRTSVSPALAIAIELRKADSCAARLPLLERAQTLGDRRSVAVLSPLCASTKRGCGRRKRSPCPAACPSEARAYFQTVTKILERQPPGR
jgi:serine/threonine protein kinase